MTARGRSLELFFVDGRPEGLLVAELFNWTGHVLLVPRTQIKQALARPETSYTGIYILLGEQDGEAMAYIGESEDIGQRIRSHDSKKDWWTKAVFVTTADNKLNKAHVRFLEARSYERAASVGRMMLDNTQVPQIPQVSEATIANMEGFLENLFMILPALGIDLFVESKRSSTEPLQAVSASSSASMFQTTNIVRFELLTPKHGISAMARLEDGEFIVEKGSIVRAGWEGKSERKSSYEDLRKELDKTGVIVRAGTSAQFAADYAFKSPSAAAAVVNGRSSNGQKSWNLIGTKKTYKQWEAEQLQGALEQQQENA